ncbi:hypothetical protein X745_23285 [Mesorhizobium sp. LNJC374B00]|nr:hypothetical protein X745_23285 [Mesorhizobium sp. LNJC374B00]
MIEDYKTGNFGTIDEHAELLVDQRYVERTLITCILSSTWTYEKAIDAADIFLAEFREGDRSSSLPDEETIESLLRSRRIRHRFPKSKARQLKASLSTIDRMQESAVGFFDKFASERLARDFVSTNFSGLGYKQSSMFLRDIGVARELAVIDIHIIWFLENVESMTVSNLSKKNYLLLEDYLRAFSEKIGISINALDRLIWMSVREFRKMKRNSGCGMQYALPLGG